jgi:hypothetical protein
MGSPATTTYVARDSKETRPLRGGFTQPSGATSGKGGCAFAAIGVEILASSAFRGMGFARRCRGVRAST